MKQTFTHTISNQAPKCERIGAQYPVFTWNVGAYKDSPRFIL
jgi:hypothetical protein